MRAHAHTYTHTIYKHTHQYINLKYQDKSVLSLNVIMSVITQRLAFGGLTIDNIWID